MADNSVMDLENLVGLFERHDVLANPSEIHGAITGMLSGGLPFTSQNWLGPLQDFFHQSQTFSSTIETMLKNQFQFIWQSLNDEDLSFQLLLPDDEQTLEVRATGLSGWIQGFLLGFGINSIDLNNVSADVSEVLQDFSNICKIIVNIEDNETNETAYMEIYEYVRISAVMCFSELGAPFFTSIDKITLH